MSDLISRKDAIDLVKDVCDAIMSSCDSHYDPETGDEVYNDIFEVDAILKCNKEIRIALANLPSAQPEIIRCKDCKYYQFADNRAFGMPVKMCEWFGFEDIDDDDYCSRAERREE